MGLVEKLDLKYLHNKTNFFGFSHTFDSEVWKQNKFQQTNKNKINHIYQWQSHQVWGFFTYLGGSGLLCGMLHITGIPGPYLLGSSPACKAFTYLTYSNFFTKLSCDSFIIHTSLSLFSLHTYVLTHDPYCEFLF